MATEDDTTGAETGAGLELVVVMAGDASAVAATADGKYCGNGATPPPNDLW